MELQFNKTNEINNYFYTMEYMAKNMNDKSKQKIEHKIYQLEKIVNKYENYLNKNKKNSIKLKSIYRI